MKTMKKIGFMLLAVVAIGTASCSNDDEGGKTAKYSIDMDSGIVLNSVTYRDADGEFVTVTNPGGSTWSKSVRVNSPFQANMEFTITNPTELNKDVQYGVSLNGGSDGGNFGLAPGESATVQASASF